MAQIERILFMGLVAITGGEMLKEVVIILFLMDTLPNLRYKPFAGDLPGSYKFWFDGGTCLEQSGVEQYYFKDGTTATRCVVPWLSISITFKNGRKIAISDSASKRPTT